MCKWAIQTYLQWIIHYKKASYRETSDTHETRNLHYQLIQHIKKQKQKTLTKQQQPPLQQQKSQDKQKLLSHEQITEIISMRYH